MRDIGAIAARRRPDAGFPVVLLPAMHQPHHGPASGESIDQFLARLASARHGVFTRAEAVRAGASRGLIDGRVATRRWHPLYPGIYRFAGTPPSRRQELLAACLAAGQGALASHLAAAALWASREATTTRLMSASPPAGAFVAVGSSSTSSSA